MPSEKKYIIVLPQTVKTTLTTDLFLTLNISFHFILIINLYRCFLITTDEEAEEQRG